MEQVFTWRKTPPIRWLTAAMIVAAQGFLIEGANAQARPDTRTMTCLEARTLVQSRGAAVLTTGQFTFERFVANGRYCVSNTQILQRAFAPTKDNASCTIGFVCQERPVNRR
ncbi:hypothetical protein GCM10011316_02990 [Roseibium aquae]|uniref:Uncharacterized protein n=1 Tax=Roseibium aquae TaxID=1323746 RepID=A0A916WVP4_9HYPH|nr:hypothetical protein [Roseibium aquae]GGB34296.1 hypothetical protein GCM10011316_02990 [Roseibium aquae]